MEIVRLERSRLADASAVLARAFQQDPAWVWLIPDAERRERVLPWLFRIGFEITSADVYAPQGELLGAARWQPPGRTYLHVGPTLRALVATPVRLGSATTQFFAYGRAVEAMRADVAGGPHWYLAGIGVDPSAQRRGIGGALLQPGIEGAAAAGVPAVLLTNNEENLPFYESHGFRVVHKGETPRGGPEAWAMVRRP
jgi:ribosomal protein S18 acetylase RimI-like enzyme